VTSSSQVVVPDIGDFEDVEVIEVLVRPGDRVEAEQSLITLESDKATMEIPSPRAGVVKELRVRVGDKVSAGAPILVLEEAGEKEEATPEAGAGRESGPEAGDARMAREAASAPPRAPAARGAAPEGTDRSPQDEAGRERVPGPPPGPRPHASPSVRRLARELGVDLARVAASGRKSRILREDVQRHVKQALAGGPAATGAAAPGVASAPALPDFARFGPVEVQLLPTIRRLSAERLQRAWATIPQVTQFDEADVTELEEFRRARQQEVSAGDPDSASDRGPVKLTLLAFLLKAAAVTLKSFPRVNSSLAEDGRSLVMKRYVHVGIAVDTEHGLVVPVLRDVDRKGLLELAAEAEEAARRARARRLRPEDLEGGCFTISSLGGIGGTAFTPIVNPPEVAILGVARAQMRPLWREGAFVPRLVLPLCLSYDHRVIDGAEAVRFTTHLARVLGDVRNLLL
jgi:pyruvate dehydrogenase E2 component (dihydrolipoamide acetyltransferase)